LIGACLLRSFSAVLPPCVAILILSFPSRCLPILEEIDFRTLVPLLIDICSFLAHQSSAVAFPPPPPEDTDRLLWSSRKILARAMHIRLLRTRCSLDPTAGSPKPSRIRSCYPFGNTIPTSASVDIPAERKIAILSFVITFQTDYCLHYLLIVFSGLIKVPVVKKEEKKEIFDNLDDSNNLKARTRARMSACSKT